MKQETRNDILSRKKEMTFLKVVRIIEVVTSLNDWAVFKCLCQLNDVKWHRYTSTHRKVKSFMNLICRKFKIWNPFDIYVYVQNKTEYFIEVNFCWLGSINTNVLKLFEHYQKWKVVFYKSTCKLIFSFSLFHLTTNNDEIIIKWENYGWKNIKIFRINI